MPMPSPALSISQILIAASFFLARYRGTSLQLLYRSDLWHIVSPQLQYHGINRQTDIPLYSNDVAFNSPLIGLDVT